MAKATMKLKSGATVVIEGTPEELDAILRRIENKPSHSPEKSTQIGQPKSKERKTANDYILGLREEGFFDNPRTAGEIKKELEAIAQFMPSKTISARLIGLVRKRELRRLDEGGKLKYVKP